VLVHIEETYTMKRKEKGSKDVRVSFYVCLIRYLRDDTQRERKGGKGSAPEGGARGAQQEAGLEQTRKRGSSSAKTDKNIKTSEKSTHREHPKRRHGAIEAAVFAF